MKHDNKINASGDYGHNCGGESDSGKAEVFGENNVQYKIEKHIE